jgi:hypothetical protein
MTEPPYANAGERVGPSDIWIIYDADDIGFLPNGNVDPDRTYDNYPETGDNHGSAGENFVNCDGHAQWVSRKNYLRNFALGTDEYHAPVPP